LFEIFWAIGFSGGTVVVVLVVVVELVEAEEVPVVAPESFGPVDFAPLPCVVALGPP
jgi:hypothetical protein